MGFKFFNIPVHDSRSAEVELNTFLRSHRVVSVERKMLDSGLSSSWAICVDYIETIGGPIESAVPGRGRVDYREILKPEEFAEFARLRLWRQEVATAESIPVYAVFTNEQLSRMVRDRSDTKAALSTIAGVGESRIEKYGDRILEQLKAWNESATDGKPA